ncbi:hypothetical protein BH23GEM6_BH23GEM6_05680 [soil metagenome]
MQRALGSRKCETGMITRDPSGCRGEQRYARSPPLGGRAAELGGPSRILNVAQRTAVAELCPPSSIRGRWLLDSPQNRDNRALQPLATRCCGRLWLDNHAQGPSAIVNRSDSDRIVRDVALQNILYGGLTCSYSSVRRGWAGRGRWGNPDSFADIGGSMEQFGVSELHAE